jgi:hypothetical protein
MRKSVLNTLVILAAVLFSTTVANAFETGCQFQPNQLNDYGTGVTKIVSEKKIPLPDAIPIQSEFEMEYADGKAKYVGTFEAFFRPTEDDFVSIIPVDVVGFDITRDRVVVYICANISENPADTHMTIYFLRGYHIDPPKNWFSDLINLGDRLNKPSLKVKAVPASLLGLGGIRKFFLKIFRFFPFVDMYFETWSLVQQLLANALGDLTGFGVERIEWNRQFLRISSGVNLDSPREARIAKTFKFKKPTLGAGATAAANRSFTGDDDQVLENLDSTKVEYEEIPETSVPPSLGMPRR